MYLKPYITLYELQGIERVYSVTKKVNMIDKTRVIFRYICQILGNNKCQI